MDPARPHLLLRVATVFTAAVLIWIAGLAGLAGLGDAHGNRLGHAARAVLTAAAAVAVVAIARRHLDRRPWTGLGLTGPRWALAGAAYWLVAAALGAAAALALGWAQLSTGPWPAPTVLLALYLPLLVFLFEALPEELLFRGYLYRNLADRLPRWVAVVGQAALFTAWAALIGAGATAERLVVFFTFGLTLGALRVATGSLWAPIGFHLAFQCVTQFASAAVRDGVLHIEGRPDLEFVAFWLLPIVAGGLVVTVVAARQGRWRDREPDLPAGPQSSAGVCTQP